MTRGSPTCKSRPLQAPSRPLKLGAREQRRWARKTVNRWATGAGARTGPRDDKRLATAEYARRVLTGAASDLKAHPKGSVTRLRAELVYLEKYTTAMDAETAANSFQFPRPDTPMSGGITAHEAVQQRIADTRQHLADAGRERAAAERERQEAMSTSDYEHLSPREREIVERNLGLDIEPEIGSVRWDLPYNDELGSG